MSPLRAPALVLLLLLTTTGLARAEDEEEPAPPHDWREAAARLRAADEIHGEAIGYAGVKTPTYAAYEVLRDGAPAPELVVLTRNEAPVLRAYALWALVEKHADVDAFAILLAHVGDDARFTGFPGGCVGWEATVGDWMLERLGGKLSEAQRARLSEIVVEKDSPMEFRRSALEAHAFPERLYEKVRALAAGGDDSALVAVARYRKEADLPLVEAALRLPVESWGRLTGAFRAVIVNPHPRFLPLLQARQAEFAALKSRPTQLFDKALAAYEK